MKVERRSGSSGNGRKQDLSGDKEADEAGGCNKFFAACKKFWQQQTGQTGKTLQWGHRASLMTCIIDILDY